MGGAGAGMAAGGGGSGNLSNKAGTEEATPVSLRV